MLGIEIYLPNTQIIKMVRGQKEFNLDKPKKNNHNIKKEDQSILNMSQIEFMSFINNGPLMKLMKSDIKQVTKAQFPEDSIFVQSINDLQKEELQSILKFNTLEFMDSNNQKKEIYSFAGEERIEYLQFYDRQSNKIFPYSRNYEFIFLNYNQQKIKVINYLILFN